MSSIGAGAGPSVRIGRPEAARRIWSWRDGERDPSTKPSAQRARVRGVIQGVVGATIGLLVFSFVSKAVASVILTIASIILLAALISPTGLFAGIERGFDALGHAASRLVTLVLLSAIFYSFFLPFGLLFRRGRRDSMKRFYEPEAHTYWSPRERERESVEALRRKF